MRRTPLPALIVVLALAVAGCGAEEKKSKPAGTSSGRATTPAAAPSSEPTPSSTPTAASGFDNEGSEVVRGTVEADTPEKVAVAEAWFAYWAARLRSYNQVQVDPALGSVGAVDAVADVVGYVGYLRGKKLHTVGDSLLSVRDIDLVDNSAQLESCMVNKSTDRRADGSPAEKLTPYYRIQGTLSKAGGTWRVVQLTTLGRERCEA